MQYFSLLKLITIYCWNSSKIWSQNHRRKRHLIGYEDVNTTTIWSLVWQSLHSFGVLCYLGVFVCFSVWLNHWQRKEIIFISVSLNQDFYDFEGGKKWDSIFVEYCLKMFCKNLQLVWCWSKDFNEEEKIH